ncbi:hypothetical protein [Glaciihabitans sp. UYNi722]|uniref:hypothetical protein n=1 Tax=Glaciihabitans sp. UYNi722 TaxID=3156344 RepID=UPI00339A2156
MPELARETITDVIARMGLSHTESQALWAECDLSSVPSQVEVLTAHIGAADAAPWPRGMSPNAALLAILATVPHTECWNAGHRVPTEVTEATIADIGTKLRLYGLELTGIDWFASIVQARVFTLGRLQFEVGAFCPPTDESAWALHVPELGPLTPAACDDSIGSAASFFDAVFGDTTTRTIVCSSWLLDAQLTEYLPADSNILDFQRRFTIFDGGHDTDAGDQDVAKFIFRRPLSELAAVTPKTRLETAALGHLAAGRHWREPSGYLRL